MYRDGFRAMIAVPAATTVVGFSGTTILRFRDASIISEKLRHRGTAADEIDMINLQVREHFRRTRRG